MKAVDLYINSILPPDLRDYHRTMDKKSVEALLAEVGRRYPDQYSDIAQHLADTGRNAAFNQGETLKLSDFEPVIDRDAVFKQMDAEIAASDKVSKSPKEKEQNRVRIWTQYGDKLEKLTAAGAKNTNLGRSVLSGARGNPLQLKAILTTPALYMDHRDRVIPMFVRHSFAEGLRPAEYLASSFGTRRSVISTKSSTARGGDFLKQSVAAATPIVVTESDCNTTNGLDFGIDDPEIQGRVMARGEGDIEAGTVVDKHVIKQLRAKGVKTIIARSPMTCSAHSGICSHCLGMLPEGKFAPKGYSAGITAAEALGEPITTGALQCLASGTLVRMADWSVKPVEQIKTGDWVLGAGADTITFPVRVNYLFDQGFQPVQLYTFALGASKQRIHLTATKIHPVLANTKTSNNKAVRFNHVTRMLPIGFKTHDFAVVLSGSTKNNSGYPVAMAYLIGVLLGDGCYTRSVGGVFLSCADKVMVEYLRDYLKPLGMKLHLNGGQKIYYRVGILKDEIVQDVKTGRTVAGFRNYAAKFLDARGMMYKYAHEKTLPPDIDTWDNASVAELVAGLYDTDGSVHTSSQGHAGISYSSTSKVMILKLRELLELRFGIRGSALRVQLAEKSKTRKHDIYSFNISRGDQVARFQKFIPLHGVKKDRLANLKLKPLGTIYRCVRKAATDAGIQQCWDLEVDSQESLFVLANGMIVHNSKHTGGAIKGEKKEFSGFDVVSQLVQSPETFPNKAVLSEKDGRISDIKEAPQGGKYVTVGDTQHYVLPGFEPIVKINDEIEAGEPLSEGISDASDIVRLRGLGEGRKYYVDRLQKAMADSGYGKPSKVNLEVLARASMNHAVVDDPEGMGNYLPDDLVSYQDLANTHALPQSAVISTPDKAVGKYLHSPALHYTIGTKLTPKMTKHLQAAGVNGLVVSDEEPQFHPEMVRLRAAAHNNPDWLARMHSSYLTTGLTDSASRARDTDTGANIHFAPRLAIGENFGKNIETTGKF